MLVATPSMLLPGSSSNASEMVALLAILVGTLTFIEYNTHYPSFVEFRDAPPLNRMRFLSLFAMVFVMTVICLHKSAPSNLSSILTALGRLIGDAADFPYSPVRLVLLALPDATIPATINTARMAAGLSYTIALATVATFAFVVRVLGWPISAGAFNVWVNLPLFDPTTGGDVVKRLQRDGRVNIFLGVLLPFLIPAAIKATSSILEPISLSDPQTLIWTISAWAFLPASMVMRGIAMLRIAELIEEKRRRTYANAEAMQAA